MVRKVLASAVANALQNPSVRASRLVVSQAFVNGGPLLQGRMRFRPGPMGRAMPFRRRTCHIHVHVADPDVTVEDGDAAPPAEPAVEPEAEVTDAPPAEAEDKPAKKKATKKKATKKAAKKKATKKPADDEAPEKSGGSETKDKED